MSPALAPAVKPCALEQLFVDQDRDWVADTIAPVLAWLPGNQPFRFAAVHTRDGASTTLDLELGWSEARLAAHLPGVRDHADRLRAHRSAQREHVAELAAYAITFVAISALMPGRRVKHMQMGAAPDMLFDITPGALRGVETAGRSRGGMSALRGVRGAKAPNLLARTDLAEVHLSLWCASPKVGIFEQVKP
jgi:hypothetical protein